MKYTPPVGSTAPDAGYTDPVEGAIPAAAVEQPMREIANVINSMGLMPSETDLTQLDQAIDLKVASVQPDLTEIYAYIDSRMEELSRRIQKEKYELCEFYYFRNPTLRPGFLRADGGLLDNAADLYPEAWAFLHTAEGRQFCVTEEEWQTMSQASWATLADGAQVGWNGVGGVPFFAPDPTTGSLRLPDLRGMYAEAAGCDGFDVGNAHGDAMPSMTGTITPSLQMAQCTEDTCQCSVSETSPTSAASPDAELVTAWLNLEVTPADGGPAAAKNQPRAWGALACVYLGRPAT